MNEVAELKKRIDTLENFIKSLQNSHSIPLAVDQSFRGRFIKDFSVITASTKSATSENQAVDENGSAIYSVLKAPDEFLEVVVGTAIKYIPVFT